MFVLYYIYIYIAKPYAPITRPPPCAPMTKKIIKKLNSAAFAVVN